MPASGDILIMKIFIPKNCEPYKLLEDFTIRYSSLSMSWRGNVRDKFDTNNDFDIHIPKNTIVSFRFSRDEVKLNVLSKYCKIKEIKGLIIYLKLEDVHNLDVERLP